MPDEPSPDARPADARFDSERDAATGRIIVIDVLRGLAILWVMTFHLWTDMTGGLRGVSPLYEHLGDRIAEANILGALTAAGELVLGSGYQGVAVFMMLSGLSLVLNAERRGEPPAVRGYAARLRKIVVPYWGGVLFLFAVFALIALAQTWTDGDTFRQQWDNVHVGVVAPVHYHLTDLPWAFTIFGPMLRDRVVTPPVASLWFVPLLLQYYLLFPFALRILRRIGPWNFAVAGIALTVVARVLFYQLAPDVIDAPYLTRTIDTVFIFRGSEFFVGMTLGYLMAHRRREMSEWVASPLDVIGLIVVGVLLQWASVSIQPESQRVTAIFTPMGQLALALFAFPLLFKPRGRFEVSAPARALVALGVISFTALIVNDGMRLVASFLRTQSLPDAVWWSFLWLVYIPGATALIAYPMARLFGLLPKRVASPAPAEQREIDGGAEIPAYV